jgi:hypothetical protein
VSRVSGMTPEFTETFPTPLQPGVLYVSATYSTAAHLCCCGCQQEVIAAVAGPVRIDLRRQSVIAALDRQLGAAMPLQLRHPQRPVRWAQSYSDTEIKQNRENDRRPLAEARPEEPTWLTRVTRRLRRRSPRSTTSATAWTRRRTLSTTSTIRVRRTRRTLPVRTSLKRETARQSEGDAGPFAVPDHVGPGLATSDGRARRPPVRCLTRLDSPDQRGHRQHHPARRLE